MYKTWGKEKKWLFLKCSFLDEICYFISLLPWASSNILKAPQEDHKEPDNRQWHSPTSAIAAVPVGVGGTSVGHWPCCPQDWALRAAWLAPGKLPCCPGTYSMSGPCTKCSILPWDKLYLSRVLQVWGLGGVLPSFLLSSFPSFLLYFSPSFLLLSFIPNSFEFLPSFWIPLFLPSKFPLSFFPSFWVSTIILTGGRYQQPASAAGLMACCPTAGTPQPSHARDGEGNNQRCP